MKLVRRAGLLAALCVAGSVWMASSATAEDVGIAVGEAAPTFTLRDQNGTEQSLDALAKRGKLAIVFYRSADW